MSVIDRGFFGTNGITGGGIPLATGVALSAKLRNTGRITVCFFGDGAANQGAFHEDVTNQMLDKLVSVCGPRFMRLTAEFNVRGGVYTTVVAEHRAPDWQPPGKVELP